MDAWGHATLVYEGGTSASTAAVILARGYDQATGLALSTEAGRATAAPIVHLITAWDGFANLRTRTDQANASTETASYDALNRLAGSTTTLTGGASLTRSYRYDASGNRTRACSGNTCSVYTYGGNGAGPHAVSAVNGNASAYAYNASGEMTKDGGRSLTWSAFGKATRITRGNTTLTLSYGPGNRRTRKTVTGPLSETVTYLGSAERLDINGSLSIRRTLAIADITIIDTGGAQSKRLYPIADHLGSTIAIADSSGHLIQGLAYADFGKRYSAGWTAALTTSQALAVNTTLSDRGYTGQESFDAIGLDDYNARLYDPSLGRFLSVDPLIGHPGSTQGINPYSYVANNPLNKTDPTGECANLIACGHFNSAGQGGWMGPKEVQGAVNKAEKHGLSKSVGDLLEKAYHGGAHLSSIAANSTGNTNVSKHQFGNQSGATGGTVSKQNGDSVVPESADLTPKQRKRLNNQINVVNDELAKVAANGGFTSTKEAAVFLHKNLDPISRQLGVEIGANIYRGSVPDSVTVFGIRTNYDKNQVGLPIGRHGWTKLADWHTHGNASNPLLQNFSPKDLRENIDQYLSTPRGQLLYYDYDAYHKALIEHQIESGYWSKRDYVSEVPQ